MVPILVLAACQPQDTAVASAAAGTTADACTTSRSQQDWFFDNDGIVGELVRSDTDDYAVCVYGADARVITQAAVELGKDERLYTETCVRDGSADPWLFAIGDAAASSEDHPRAAWRYDQASKRIVAVDAGQVTCAAG